MAWLDIDLAYRGFEAEMARFDALFTGPSGLFLLACEGEALVGCVGLLRHDATTAEVKRLYVRPSCRGLALGRQLMTALMGKAAALGVRRLILDAVPPTQAAQVLYRSLGFAEIAPYYADPLPGTRFFSLSLEGCLPCLS